MSTKFDSVAHLGDRVGLAAAEHIDAAMRVFLEGTAHMGETSLVLVTGEPHPLGNFALLTDAHDQAAARAAIDKLKQGDAPTALLSTCVLSKQVGDLIAGEGYQLVGEMPAMAVDIDSLASTSLPAGYKFERIGRGDIAEQWVDAFAEGYVLPRGLAALFTPNGQPNHEAPEAIAQFYGVLKGGKIVSTSVLYLAHGLAGIYCVSTIPDERGKGLGAHVTAEPLRIAKRLGYGVGVLQSSHEGHSVYKHLGFKDYAGVPMYTQA